MFYDIGSSSSLHYEQHRKIEKSLKTIICVKEKKMVLTVTKNLFNSDHNPNYPGANIDLLLF